MSFNAVNNAPSASQSVLNTTELLEQILSYLPMPKIVGKTRVSRNWKAVIEGSPALQRELFLRHRDSEAEVIWFDHWFPKPQDLAHNLSTEQKELLNSLVNTPVYITPIELNPLVNWENLAGPHVSHEMRTIHPEPFHASTYANASAIHLRKPSQTLRGARCISPHHPSATS